MSLKSKLRELIETRKELIASGAAKDYAHYKQMVGEKTGLELAIRELEDLQKKRAQADGDNDE